MASQVSGSSASPGTRGSRWSWLLAGGTFLAGCALGAVVVGVADVGRDGGPSTPAGPAPAAAEEGPGAGPGGATGDDRDAADSGRSGRVPQSCVRTADQATTLVEHVDRMVAAVADLQPERLRQSVDDVQQLRDEVRDVADQCRAEAARQLQDVADAEGGAAPPTPAS